LFNNKDFTQMLIQMILGVEYLTKQSYLANSNSLALFTCVEINASNGSLYEVAMKTKK